MNMLLPKKIENRNEKRDAKLRSINVYIIVDGITVPIEIAAMEFPFEVRIRICEDHKFVACCQFIFSCHWPHTDIFTRAIPFPTIFLWVLCIMCEVNSCLRHYLQTIGELV